MEGLARYCRLLCVEPPITIDTPFRKPKVFREWLARKRGLRQLSEGHVYYKPVALVPYYVSLKFPSIAAFNRTVMKASLRYMLFRGEWMRKYLFRQVR